MVRADKINLLQSYLKDTGPRLANTVEQQLFLFDQDEDAFDMRKALKRDVLKKSIIPLDRDIHIDELEY